MFRCNAALDYIEFRAFRVVDENRRSLAEWWLRASLLIFRFIIDPAVSFGWVFFHRAKYGWKSCRSLSSRYLINETATSRLKRFVPAFRLFRRAECWRVPFA